MAGQDIKKRLAPGGAQPVNVSGDYIYLKFADRPVDVIINGGRSGQTRVTMEAGDKYRPGPFEQFEIENPDTERAAQIIVTVGEGDYNRQLVKGEIGIEPILRAEDGTTKPDTRHKVSLVVYPGKTETASYSMAEKTNEVALPEIANYPTYQFPVSDREIGICRDFNSDDIEVQVFDIKTGKLKYSRNPAKTKRFNPVPRDMCYAPERGFLMMTGSSDIVLYKVVNREYISLFNVETIQGVHGSTNEETIAYDFSRNLVAISARYNDVRSVIWLDPWTWEVRDIRAIEDGSGGTGQRLRIGQTGEIYQTDSSRQFYMWTGQDQGYQFIRKTYDFRDDQGLSLNGFMALERELVFVPNTANRVIRYAALNDFETKPQMIVQRQGCGLPPGLVLNQGDIYTNAELTATETDLGVIYEGELIRAVLEMFYQRSVPDDYLDHVYAMSKNNDANGYQGKDIVTGNRTFAAYGVPDDFSIRAPAAITMTIDNEMELGAAL